MNGFFEISFAYLILIFIFLIITGCGVYIYRHGTFPSLNFIVSIVTVSATLISPLLAIATYDSWKKQHVVNQQEAIIVRVLDQIDKVDIAAKDYFKPIHIPTVVNDNEKYANEIYSSEIQLVFELKKLETLLEKTKEIDFTCSDLEKLNVIKFRELVEKHYTYLIFNTYPILHGDRELRKAIIKNNEQNLFIVFGKVNIQWNNLSNDIRTVVLGWSGKELLSRLEESGEKTCDKTSYDHDKYAKEIFGRAYKNS